MSILKSVKLVSSAAIAAAMVGSFSGSSNASRLAISEVKLMTQNPNNSSNEIRKNDLNEIILPEHMLKKIEEMERKAQREQAEASAIKMAQKTPKEREEMEKERKRLDEIEFAPETRTKEEVMREEERAIKIFDELKAKRKRD
ncbi:MAG: hypothetical protein LH702_01720 [Phormidesmis sp. CAN_BIN44]|nr:hypothetical protein [Phormidesmis sp. CAN_BIN44]